MLKLAPIFASHAIFQQNSTITVKGETDAKSVSLTLLKDGKALYTSSCTCSEGSFGCELETPSASYEAYELLLSADGESVLLTDILFGEVWLATGQSNMELQNFTHPECDDYLDSMSEKHIRAYFAPVLEADAEYPRYPLKSHNGSWGRINGERQVWENSSACGTAFVNDLYEILNKNAEVPVALLSLARGSIPIESMLPEEAYRAVPKIMKYLEGKGRLPESRPWNTHGEKNYTQAACQYNHLIAPVLGIKCRGMIWYQGESNAPHEITDRIYSHMLRALRESFAERFAISAPDEFPILSSQLFPWPFQDNGGCSIAYVNRSILSLALKEPKLYPCVPVCDFRLRWAFHQQNHPIHPTHKYSLGSRMAKMAAQLCYGRRGRGVQKLPASYKSVRREGSSLYLSFRDVGSGLFIKGGRLRGIYIRSEKGVYTPAYAEVVDAKTLRVYHPFIEEPKHVCYACSHWEFECNLYAGEYAVFPFCTEPMRPADKPLSVQLKDFTNTEIDSITVLDSFTNDHRICFRQPLFNANAGSTVCFDTDFELSGRSVRVHGETSSFGMYIKAYKNRALDLKNYSEIRASILNTVGLTARIVVYYAGGDEQSFLGEKIKQRKSDFCDYLFDISSVNQEKEITKMEFRFEIDETNPVNKYVNVDCIILVPKA